jgi:hypothetical protein
MIKSINSQVITRRDFIRGVAYGTLGLTLGYKTLSAVADNEQSAIPFAAENPLSHVVLIRRNDVIDKNNKINKTILSEMMDTALKTFSGETDLLAAWRKYIHPDDKVGVKVTHCSWMRIHTNESLIKTIQIKLSDVSIPKSRIHVEDYGLPFEKCTALINVPSVKVHTLTGIAASIKNYINFIQQPSDYHHEGSVNLGKIWLMPHVKGKTRLIIVDMLQPYFGPGPQINPLHRWNYKGILVGTDPVAIDTVCTRICQMKRNLFKGEEWLISPPPKSLAAADTKYGLGTSNPIKIQLIRLGWEEDILL